MKNSKSIKYLFALALAVLMVGILPSCNEELDGPDGPRPFADFTCVSSEANYLVMNFTNTSKFSTSYVWDFGGGATSTDENPSHTFSSAGIYSVSLTAVNDGGETAVAKVDVEVIDTNVKLAILAGTDGKKWIIQRQGIALGIYSPEGGAWWEFGGGTPLGERPCVIDDEITINRDGSIVVDTKNTVYLDGEGDGGWNDALGAGCHDESEAGLWIAADGSDVSDFANGGDYTFVYDKDANSFIVSGSGFYIGLTSKTNDGDKALPVSTKTYQITNLVDGDGVDSLQLTMPLGDGASWKFNLVSYDDFSMAPDVPTSEPPPTGKPVEVHDLFDDFTGVDNSSNITWAVNEVKALTLGADNPDAVETFKCAKYEKGEGTTENVQVTLDYIMDLSTRNQFSMKGFFPSTNDYAAVDPAPEGWAPHTSLQKTIVLRFYDSTHGAPWETQTQKEYVLADTDLDKWVDINFDFSDIADNVTYDKVIIQIGSEGHHMPGTFYIADFKLN